MEDLLEDMILKDLMMMYCNIFKQVTKEADQNISTSTITTGDIQQDDNHDETDEEWTGNDNDNQRDDDDDNEDEEFEIELIVRRRSSSVAETQGADTQ